MITFNLTIVVLFFLCFCNLPKYISNKKYLQNKTVMNKNATLTIRGIAIIGIVIHHFSQYFDFLGPFQGIIKQSGYAFTSVFFLLSGYGCYFAFKKFQNYNSKKECFAPVIKWVLQHSLRLYFDFIIVLVINCIIFSVVGLKEYISIFDLFKYLLTISLPSWTNWYVKIQILCYIVLGISFLISNKYKDIISLLIILFYIFIAWKSGLQSMWFTSVICFPIGLIIAKYLPKLNIKRNQYLIIFVLSIALFGALFYLQSVEHQALFRLLSSCVLPFMIVSIVALYDFDNTILRFVGNISFEIYLLHLVILRVCLQLKLESNISLIVILAFSIILGFIINKLIASINNNIFDKKAKNIAIIEKQDN